MTPELIARTITLCEKAANHQTLPTALHNEAQDLANLWDDVYAALPEPPPGEVDVQLEQVLHLLVPADLTLLHDGFAAAIATTGRRLTELEDDARRRGSPVATTYRDDLARDAFNAVRAFELVSKVRAARGIE